MANPGYEQLARIKLGELERQRLALSARYDELDALGKNATLPLLDRVDGLLSGMRALRFGQTPLHPALEATEVGLAVIRAEAAHSRADDGLLTHVFARLQRELAQGRTRVEFARLFGVLITEQLAATEAPSPDEPVDQDTLRMITGPAPEMRAELWAERAANSRPKAFAWLTEVLSENKGPLVRPPDAKAVRELLDRLATGPMRSAAFREAVRKVRRDAAAVSEYVDVLKIMLERLDDWRWDERTTPFVEWQHGHFRVSLEESLLDALLLEHVGLSMTRAVNAWRHGTGSHTVVENPARLYEAVWANIDRVQPTVDGVRAYYRAALLASTLSTFAQAADTLAVSTADPHLGGYDAVSAGAFGAPRGQDQLSLALHTHITARGHIEPERSLHVLQWDFERFYPSVPHAAVLATLGRFGLSARWQRFVAKVLTPVLRTPSGKQAPVSRGLMPGRVLSRLLSDLLLLPLEQAVHAGTGLRILRNVDDAYLVATDRRPIGRAWEIVNEFARDHGLTVHPKKSGYQRVRPRDGHEDPDKERGALPSGTVHWGVLRLDDDGVFRPEPSAAEALRAWTAERVTGARSLLEAVRQYNVEAQYLLQSLAPAVQLGEGHLDACAEIVGVFHHALWPSDRAVRDATKAAHEHSGSVNVGRITADISAPSTDVWDAGMPKREGPPVGVREALLRSFRARRPMDPGHDPLPSALLHWPTTAGGLGLVQPFIVLHAFRPKGRSDGALPPPPSRPKELADENVSRLVRQLAKLEEQQRRGDDALVDPNAYRARRAQVLACVASARQQWDAYTAALGQWRSMKSPETSAAFEELTRDFVRRGTELGGRTQRGLSHYWRWVLAVYGPSLLDVVGTFRFLLTELVPLPLLLGARAGAPGFEEGEDASDGDDPGPRESIPDRARGDDRDDVPF